MDTLGGSDEFTAVVKSDTNFSTFAVESPAASPRSTSHFPIEPRGIRTVELTEVLMVRDFRPFGIHAENSEPQNLLSGSRRSTVPGQLVALFLELYT